MPRRRRPNLPGTPFHLTARLQNGEHLFTDLQSRVITEIERSTRTNGMRLLAYAVMSNHLHLVVVQGCDPLSWHMQALLRRVALIVQRTHRRQGHVFERRFHSSACIDADHLRNVIAYVHLNAVRAGVCKAPEDYDFTSHVHYCAPAAGVIAPITLAAEDALRVFASTRRYSLRQCREDYLYFLDWRMKMDAFVAEGGDPRAGLAPIRPVCEGGDRYWKQEFSTRRGTGDRSADGLPAEARPDLEKIARRALTELAPDLPLYMLRSSSRARPIVAVRRQAIARALEIGYRATQVARYFDVSPSTVSSIALAMRAARVA